MSLIYGYDNGPNDVSGSNNSSHMNRKFFFNVLGIGN